ncbi:MULTISPECIES: hypothetical protein [Achromobacter]|nr:hypothetical protein LMG26684_01701 [Achromobacter mucicolens]CAB3849703.1 hypothetical protein LMG3415_01865 [Achromobacter mucicolens]
MQWGNANAVNGSVIVTFPIAFPTANFTGVTDTDAAAMCTAYRSVSKSQCEIYLHNPSGVGQNGTVRWIALGY